MEVSSHIDNPVTGEHVTFIETKRETDGSLIRMRFELPPGAQGVTPHYHITYHETFEVVEGALDLSVGNRGDHRVLGPGESASVPIGTCHRFWNAGSQPVIFTLSVRPARWHEEALRAAFGLARDGKVNRSGVPTNVWELALIFELSESYLPGLPLPLQRGVFGLLAWIARRRGYDPLFHQYTGASRGEPGHTTQGHKAVEPAMVVAQHSVDVSRGLEEVFAYVTDLASWREWALRVESVSCAPPGPPREGASLVIANRVFGRAITTPYTITRVVPGHRFEFASSSGPAPARFVFAVEPTPIGSRLTETVEMRPRGALRLLGWLIGWATNRQLAANHQTLKRRLEGREGVARAEAS